MSRGRPHDFPAAAREALADAQLRANLRGATQTIRARRAAAIAELPDWEELREQARRVKDDALERLDELLARVRGGGHGGGRSGPSRRGRWLRPTPLSPRSPVTTA